MVVTDEPGATITIDGKCVHGKEIRTNVWIRPHSAGWQVFGQFKCAKCPFVPVVLVPHQPTKVMTTEGKKLTVSFRN